MTSGKPHNESLKSNCCHRPIKHNPSTAIFSGDICSGCGSPFIPESPEYTSSKKLQLRGLLGKIPFQIRTLEDTIKELRASRDLIIKEYPEFAEFGHDLPPDEPIK